MNSSFLELHREEVTECYGNLAEIAGGMDRLPGAFLPELGPCIRFGAKMIALNQEQVATVHCRTPAGQFQATGDHVLVTVPFAVLRHVETLKPFSPAKQRAIRQLHYDASAKILFQWGRQALGGRRRDPRRRHGHRPPDPCPLLPGSRARDRPRDPARELHLVGGRPALGLARGRRGQLAQALERVRRHPPAGDAGVRGGRLVHVAPRRVRRGRVRPLRSGPADAPLRSDRPTRGAEDPCRGRARLAHHAWIQGAIESALRAALAIHLDGVRP